MKALEAIRELVAMRPEELVIDIECDIDKDSAHDHPNHYEMLCVGICYAKGKVLVIGENACKDPQVRQELGDLFRSVKLVAQNGKFRPRRTLPPSWTNGTIL
jgi:hypothetical protein